jgi:hypothetical protein
MLRKGLTVTTNQGIQLLRTPTPELIQIITDHAQPLAKRWVAFLQADGFNPERFPLHEQDQAYVMSELQRVCKALHNPQHKGPQQ